MNIGTPFGLAFASGINAYLPLLSFAVAARWLHLYKVNPNFAFITSDWFLAALIILTLVDFVTDKIPVLDHTWDVIHTVVRPIMGALVAAASSPNFSDTIKFSVSNHSTTEMVLAAIPAAPLGGNLGLLIILVLGGLLAIMSHTAKATTRLVSTLTTAGLLNTILSLLEDGFVLLVILLSLFVPVIMLIVLVLFVIFFGPQLLRIWGKWFGRHV
jgi:hypothetical protein